jgi:predicted nucleic acid-binding protein
MIIDANIAVHWFVETQFSRAVVRFRDRTDLAAPSLVLLEAANVLYKHARGGRFDPRRCARSIRILEDMLRDVVPNENVLPQAIRLALTNHHSVYDCLYLALAIEREEPFVTADRRLAAVAGSLGLEVELILPEPPL